MTLQKSHTHFMLVKHLSEPWFSLIYCGKKTIEIRLDRGHFHELQNSDISIKYDLRYLLSDKY